MILIPTTHGRAGVASKMSEETAARTSFRRVREDLQDRLAQLYRDEFGAEPHRDWIQPLESERDQSTGEVTCRLESRAPERSRLVEVHETRETRRFQIPVSTDSRIPLVLNPYQSLNADTDPFDRPERYLTFKGWSPESGLMVFGRTR